MNRKPLILIALLLAAFAINLDTTIVNVALPKLALELNASNSQLQWIVDAFNLFFAASVLVAGSLSDRFGRKGMLLACPPQFCPPIPFRRLAAVPAPLVPPR